MCPNKAGAKQNKESVMQKPSGPWWREPWPWILMAGPALAMAACGLTIYLAVSHADPPADGAARRGLVVEHAPRV